MRSVVVVRMLSLAFDKGEREICDAASDNKTLQTLKHRSIKAYFCDFRRKN
jgi:hypothetical protein